MDRYHRTGRTGSQGRQSPKGPGPSTAQEILRRKVRNMHAKHAMVSLLRAAVLAGLIFLGLDVVESSWGTALAITAGFLSLHTLLYAVRGHWTIARFRRARLYWLQDTTVDQDVSPVFVASEEPNLLRKSA